MPGVYATSRIKTDSRDVIIAASEFDKGQAYAYDLDNEFQRIPVWEQGGGTMSIVQIPGTNDFLATQHFIPTFAAEEAFVVKASWNGSEYSISKVAQTPFLHRFDLIPFDENTDHFVGTTITTEKDSIEDWSRPGHIQVGTYNRKTNQFENLKNIGNPIHKNHGYKSFHELGYSLITGVEGVYKLTYPTTSTDWQLEKLFDEEVSDIYPLDVNGDGLDEYFIIQGFHGPVLRLMDNQFNELFKKQDPTPFGHAGWGGVVEGQPVFVFGHRDGKKDLSVFTFENQNGLVVHEELIESGAGPSNLFGYTKNDQFYVASANRENDQFIVYELDKGEN
ncbi:MAG: hypothetical protein LBM27_06585 [Lactobacillaceae bacterium]|nr:hypothetical protein [Lactobacillaceae bacterium]